MSTKILDCMYRLVVWRRPGCEWPGCLILERFDQKYDDSLRTTLYRIENAGESWCTRAKWSKIVGSLITNWQLSVSAIILIITSKVNRRWEFSFANVVRKVGESTPNVTSGEKSVKTRVTMSARPSQILNLSISLAHMRIETCREE